MLVPLLILETIIAIGLALAVAYVRGSLTDRMVMIVCTVGLSISILVYIIVFQYVFAYKLGWFPVQGWGDSFWENLFALRVAADPDRAASSASRRTCGSTARSCSTRSTRTTCARRAPRALGENRIMWVHVLRNASIPIITHVMAALPGAADRRVPDRALLLDSRHRPRGDPRRRALATSR